MKISELLNRMWFAPISAQDPVFMAPKHPYECWLTIESQIPMTKLMNIELKKEGLAPLYLHEVDLDKDLAIISLVMEC